MKKKENTDTHLPLLTPLLKPCFSLLLSVSSLPPPHLIVTKAPKDQQGDRDTTKDTKTKNTWKRHTEKGEHDKDNNACYQHWGGCWAMPNTLKTQLLTIIGRTYSSLQQNSNSMIGTSLLPWPGPEPCRWPHTTRHKYTNQHTRCCQSQR